MLLGRQAKPGGEVSRILEVVQLATRGEGCRGHAEETSARSWENTI
jgi:hypothetical protein